MGRWAPDARGRLQQAAMELYTERGYDQTTTADIAERAGLTERTYFRHFPDKREVLFDSTGELERLVVAGIRDAPADAVPVRVVATGLAEGAALLESLGDGARRRAAVIAANAELQERELAKLIGMARAVADVLRERGVAAQVATLTAEAGVTVFRVAFDRWVADPAGPSFPDVLTAALVELRAALTAH